MNRGRFASEYTEKITVKRASNTEVKNLVYAAFLAGMKKERGLGKNKISKSKV